MRVQLAVVACAALIGFGAAGSADDKAAVQLEKSAAPPATGDVAAWVDGRVEKLRPSAEDKRFDEIGWSTDILTAEKLAKGHARPLFLFTHDGRMAEGRC